MTTVMATSKAKQKPAAARNELEPEGCPTCGRLTILGPSPAGEAVRVDVEPVSLNGEVVAMLEGRMTYARFGNNLAPRVSGRGVRDAPAEGLYVLHACGLVALAREVFRIGGGGE